MDDRASANQNDALRAHIESMEKVCDDRYKRDAERIKMLEDIQRDQTVLMTRQTEISAHINTIITDHETRIRMIEENPRKWSDKVLSALISVIVSTLIAALIFYLQSGK